MRLRKIRPLPARPARARTGGCTTISLWTVAARCRSQRAVSQRFSRSLIGAFTPLPIACYAFPPTIGRASGRERVCQYVLNLVEAVSFKKTHIQLLNDPINN